MTNIKRGLFMCNPADFTSHTVDKSRGSDAIQTFGGQKYFTRNLYSVFKYSRA